MICIPFVFFIFTLVSSISIYKSNLHPISIPSSSKYISWCHADLEIEPKYNYDAFKENIINLENQKCIIKGSRKGRTILDIIFTAAMSLFTSMIFKTKLSDVNAQPKIFPRQFLNLLKNPPDDFSLDLYLLIVAKFNNYKILYGGSVKASNAREITSLPNVDGVLIGGASLKSEEFTKIIED